MPKGVYGRTKPMWNKGLSRETDNRVLKNSLANIGISRNKGQIPWNKFLTTETDERIRKQIQKRKG